MCNWDAEEYGLVSLLFTLCESIIKQLTCLFYTDFVKKIQIGSTEWVEENRAMLTSRTVAYLNVDSAVSGPGFDASATPQLDELLKEASKQVF